jgi:hypothetical protein|uniref:Uncharacterized protein n=1 Tax=viral metagenome TaxID=1070528 RepID=A0A6C0LVM5_9ZZZZ
MTDIISSPIANINFADFAVFADMYNDTGEKWNIYTDENNDHQDYDDALKDYYDAYCTYLVSRKYNGETIKTFRKNAIIDFYITQNNIDNSLRNVLDKYYIANIIDKFNKQLNPPPCFFHQARMAKKYEEEMEKRDIETDDVAQHYINLKNMYKYVHDEMSNITNGNNNLSDNNILNDYSDELESNNDKYFDYYDEYYDIYDSEYYSDNDYYSDNYSDDYDNNDY